MVEFAYGMFLYQVFATTTSLHSSRLTSSYAVTVNLLFIIGLLARPLNPHWLSLTSVLFGFLIYQLAARRTWLSSMLSMRWVLILGGASYAIYILQGPVRAWIKIAVPSELLSAAINPVVLVVLSVSVYLWIEEPARRAIMRSAESLIVRLSATLSSFRPDEDDAIMPETADD
jgi:peptidoglycan/LPS O-acetylase OafA/YrhL